ncbi:MAG: tetratricopeptide repeat protein [Phycisphaerae bacterium]
MARQRLNKNVIGWLTIGGVFLAVSSVAVATFSLAKKPPEVYAREAAGMEKAGDMKRAAMLYDRAYDQERQVKYKIESSRVRFELGDVGNALDGLKRANAQEPRDTDVLRTLLSYYWRLADNGWDVWSEMREHADKLLEIEPKNVDGLACRARALDEMRTGSPENAKLAEEALKTALEVGPNDPRLAQIRAQLALRELSDISREARQPGRNLQEMEKRINDGKQAVAALLTSAVDAKPDSPELVRYAARVLVEFGRQADAEAILQRGLSAKPDDLELQVGLAATMLAKVTRDEQKPGPEQTAEAAGQADAILLKALERDPSLYEAYNVRSQFRLLLTRDNEDPDARAKGYGEALEILRDGLRRTVSIESIRAVLGAGYRIQLIAQGFDTAVEFFQKSTRPEDKKIALDHVRQFLADAMTKYPELYVTAFMQGQMAVLDNDIPSAVAAYIRGEEKTRVSDINAEPALGRYNRMAKERLSYLCRQDGKDELARKYGQQAVEMYATAGEAPPLPLCLNLGELLIRLKRGQEALDWADVLKRQFGEKPELDGLRVAALTLLGRPEEARELVKADSPEAQMQVARIAVYSNDLPGAEAALQRVLEANAGNAEALSMYLQVMSVSKRQEAALAFVRAQHAKATSPDVQLAYEMTEISLSETDPAVREQKLVARLEKIEDPQRRAKELFSFYGLRQQFDKAQPYLDELEKAKPDDIDVLKQQFSSAIALKDIAKAERYLAKLAPMNADRAKGAVMRGQLAATKGDLAAALQEYRAAQADLPLDTNLKLNIAQVLLAQEPRRYEEALEVLKQVVEVEPRHFMANKLIYGIYEATGRQSEGVPYLKIAREIMPGDPLIAQRSQFLDEEENPQLGIERREKQRAAKPDDAANLRRLAQLYGRVGDLDKAGSAFDAALAAEPNNRELGSVAAEYFSNNARREAEDGNAQTAEQWRAKGVAFLSRYRDALQGAERLAAELLIGRFLARTGDDAGAEAAFVNAGKRIEELIQDDDKEKEKDTRRRAAASIAFELADHYERLGKWENMQKSAQDARALLVPTEVAQQQRARMIMIQSLLRQSSAVADEKQAAAKLDDAEKEARAFAADYPSDPRGSSALAQVQIGRNDYSGARETLTKVLGENKDNAWAYFVRGQLNLQLGRYPEARDDLLQAKRIAPNGFNLVHRQELVRTYKAMQQIPLAEAELRELVKAAPNRPEFPQALIALLREANQLPKAQEFVAEMTARWPNEGFWRFQAGRLLVERREFVAALEPFKKAIDLTDGKRPLFVSEYLATFLRANRPQDAVNAFQTLRPDQMGPLVRGAAAEAYAATRQMPQAKEQLRLALIDAAAGTNQDSAGIMSTLVSRTGALLGRDECVVMLRGALTSGNLSDQQAVRFNLALSRLLVQGDSAQVAEGAKLVEVTLPRAAPNSIEYNDLLMTRALVCDRNRDAPGAISAYEEILKGAPENIQALNNIAFTLAENAREREALPYADRIQRVLQNQPEKRTPDVYDTIGWVYYQNDQFPKAETALSEAVQGAPDNATMRYHLGKTLLKLNRNAEAKREFQRMLEAAQKSKNADDQRLAQSELSKL